VTTDPSYRIATSKIISDVIDGEAVLVNLDNGDYYTLDPVGLVIWRLMEAGLSTDGIVRRLAESFTARDGEIREGVRGLLTHLVAEGLVIDTSPTAPPAHTPPIPNDIGTAFIPPVLTKYTDMEDLLTLDPIHEVDDFGWPHVPKSDTA